MPSFRHDTHKSGLATRSGLILSPVKAIPSMTITPDRIDVAEATKRKIFVELCHEPKSLERIAYLLEHNKPLRN